MLVGKWQLCRKTKRNIYMTFFLAPVLILYTLFIFYPNVLSFYYAFLKWDGISQVKHFIGIQNFVDILHDQYFLDALTHNLIYLVTVPIITFVLAMFFAVVLTQRNYQEAGFYKVIFYFPNIISISLVGLMWIFIFSPRNGILNTILYFLGFKQMENFPWLGNPDTALAALIAPQIWTGVGFYMILMIASINGIPSTLFEAAEIDGAGKLTQTFRITIPLVWNMIQISFIYFIICVFGTFQLILVTTGGGPLGSTELIGSYMMSFIMNRSIGDAVKFYPSFGYASAIGVVTFFISIFFTLVLNKVMKRDTFQY